MRHFQEILEIAVQRKGSLKAVEAAIPKVWIGVEY